MTESTSAPESNEAAAAPKPYDLKVLGEKIISQARGKLNGVEQELEEFSSIVYLATKEWLKESAALSDNKVDDFASKFYDYADQYVLPQIKKIDLNGDGQ